LRVLDNAVTIVPCLISDLEFVEIGRAQKLPRLDPVGHPFAVALISYEIAVVIISNCDCAGRRFNLDNAAERIMLERTLLAGGQNRRFVEICRTDFPRHEGSILVVYFLDYVAGAIPNVTLSKVAVPIHFYEKIS